MARTGPIALINSLNSYAQIQSKRLSKMESEGVMFRGTCYKCSGSCYAAKRKQEAVCEDCGNVQTFSLSPSKRDLAKRKKWALNLADTIAEGDWWLQKRKEKNSGSTRGQAERDTR